MTGNFTQEPACWRQCASGWGWRGVRRGRLPGSLAPHRIAAGDLGAGPGQRPARRGAVQPASAGSLPGSGSVIETGNATTSPNTGPALLSVQGLKVAYVRVEALSGLDLTVHAGEILTGIGSNGAGKRTFLNARFGSLPLKDGRILLEGAPAQAVGVEQQAERGLALVPEARAPFAVRQHDGDRHSAAGRSPIPLGKPGHAPAHTGRGAGDVSAAGRPGLPAGLYAFGRRAASGERRAASGG
jgi:hypothetical protein